MLQSHATDRPRSAVVTVLAVVLSLLAAFAATVGVADANPDTQPPTSQPTAPSGTTTFDQPVVVLSGVANDAVGVASVDVAVFDRDQKLWFDVAADTWQAGRTWSPATVDLTDPTNATWTFDFTAGVDGGRYFTKSQATDTSGNVQSPPGSLAFDLETPPPPPNPADLPTFRDVLGGPGLADMYPSGLEVAPDGTIVVADTGANRVSKYAADGTLLWQVGQAGNGVGDFDNPRDIGIDSTGTIYVADTANARIVKLAPDGSWLGSSRGDPADKIRSPIGVTVTADVVYVADGASRKVRVLDLALDQTFAFGQQPGCTFSAIRDVDVDAAGNFYIANYLEKNVLKMSPTGACLTSWGQQGTGPGDFKNPYGVRVAHDPVLGRQLVYVNDSNNGRNQVFELDGTYVGEMGMLGDPADPGQYAHSRRVAVATDGSGDVWIADLWGWKIERWARTPTGWAYAQTIGTNQPGLADDAVFHDPHGVAVDTDGHLWVADTVHHRFVHMTVGGQVLRACGVRAFAGGGFNWPRGIAVDQATGELWAADTKQSRLQVMDPTSCGSVAVLGMPGTPLGEFNWPMSIAIRQSDRLAFVADTRNHRVQVWDVATRSVLTSFDGAATGTAFNHPQGITVDPATGNVLVADTRNDRVVELSFAGGVATVVRVLAGDLLDPEGVAVDGTGRVFVADTGNDRMVVFAADGSLVGPFTAPDGLHAPAAVTVDPDERILVSDAANNRLVVFSYDAPPPPPPPPGGPAIPVYTGDFAGPALADVTPVDLASTSTHHYAFDVARYRVVRVDRTTGLVDATAGGILGELPTRFAAARALATAANGDVYVADTVQDRIVRLDANLAMLGEWGTTGTGPSQFLQVYGIAVGTGRDAGGGLSEIVYTVDGGGPGGVGRIQRFAPDGTYVGEFAGGVTFDQPRMIEVNPATNDVWVVNSRSREVVVIDVDGNERFRFGTEGSGPGQFLNDPRGIAISPDGLRVFVSDDGNRRVQEFDADGGFVAELGRPGGGTGWELDEPRGLAVTPDGKLVVADQWGHAIVEWNADRTFARSLFGTAAPVGGVNAPRGLARNAATNRVYASDWWNQRIARWNGDGTNPTAWGERGTRDEIGSINFAWDVAVQDGTGWVYVANRESHEVEVFDHTGDYVARWGDRGSGPGQLEFPQGLAFDPTDGTLLVVDSGNHRVNRYAVNASGIGTFVDSYGGLGTGAGSFDTPTGVDVAADGTVWVADTRNDRLQRRDTGGSWTAFGKAVGMSVVDGFKLPWGVTVAPDGDVWVADSGNDRLVAMSPTGDLRWLADGDALGSGDLYSPFAILFLPGGRALVSDTFDNRVIELATDQGAPGGTGGTTPSPYVPDSQDPDGTITSPTRNEELPTPTVTFSGTATDDAGVALVEYGVRDRDTNLWWQSDGSWGPYRLHPANLATPNATSTTWSIDWTAPAGRYAVTVRAKDAAGNTDPTKPFVPFELVDPTSDATPPTFTVDTPQAQATYPNALLTFDGDVFDDTEVGRVDVAVRDLASGQWLRGDGSWGAYEVLSATLAQPGTTASAWTFDFTPPAEGEYGVSVKAYDAADNKATSNSWIRFEIQVPDSNAPTVAVTTPTTNGVYPSGTELVIDGQADDDVGVDEVLVAIRDRDTGLWWRDDGSWGGYQARPATLTAPGALSTGFSWGWTPPSAGRFAAVVKAFDAAGNATSRWTPFEAS